MRALVLEDWWSLVVAERPDPIAGPGDVLLEVVATGICGSDLHGYTGENGRRRPGQVMGHETVGRVAALGPGVDGPDAPAVGDSVVVNPVIGCGRCDQCGAGAAQNCRDKVVIGVTPDRPAAFAELLVAPARNVVPLTRGLPVEYGALIEPLAVGYHAVRRGRVRRGDAVLVIGGGPIGQACVLGAFRAGARAVAVSEPDGARRGITADLGATAIDPGTGSVPELSASALDGPPDVVLDAVGSAATLRDGLSSAPTGAPIVLVGMAAPEVAVAAYEVSTRERSIVGSFCYSPAEFRSTARWAGTVGDALRRLVDERVPLEGAPDAFDGLARGIRQASKVLVLPQRT